MATKNTLRVSVSTVVEIDVPMWERVYRTGESVSEIREAVKDMADEVVREHFQRVGVLAEVRGLSDGR